MFIMTLLLVGKMLNFLDVEHSQLQIHACFPGGPYCSMTSVIVQKHVLEITVFFTASTFLAEQSIR